VSKSKIAEKLAESISHLPVEYLDPNSVIPHPLNWKKSTPEQMKVIADSISAHGWIGEGLLNKRTNTVLDGHRRREYAIEKGIKMPFKILDVSEEEQNQILACYDRPGELRKTDEVALTQLLTKLAATIPEKQNTIAPGWTRSHLDDSLQRLAALQNLDTGFLNKHIIESGFDPAKTPTDWSSLAASSGSIPSVMENNQSNSDSEIGDENIDYTAVTMKTGNGIESKIPVNLMENPSPTVQYVQVIFLLLPEDRTKLLEKLNTCKVEHSFPTQAQALLHLLGVN